MTVRGRQRETERQRDRETDRERERETDRQTDRQTDTSKSRCRMTVRDEWQDIRDVSNGIQTAKNRLSLTVPVDPCLERERERERTQGVGQRATERHRDRKRQRDTERDRESAACLAKKSSPRSSLICCAPLRTKILFRMVALVTLQPSLPRTITWTDRSVPLTERY